MNRSKILLWFEMLLLFAGLPLLAWIVDVRPVRLGLLLGGTLYTIGIMRNNSNLWRRIPHGELGRILVRFTILALILTTAVALADRISLFSLPRQHPGLWLLIMLLYPLLSALPQEYVYRRFFFARYQSLLGNRLLEVLNIILFGGLHLIYGNWEAVVLATAGGVLFTRNYKKNDSLLAVSVEHALFGMWIFTVGLGRFFFR
jgi:membrane protease YdiL (CAAX protease family)